MEFVLILYFPFCLLWCAVLLIQTICCVIRKKMDSNYTGISIDIYGGLLLVSISLAASYEKPLPIAHLFIVLWLVALCCAIIKGKTASRCGWKEYITKPISIMKRAAVKAAEKVDSKIHFTGGKEQC